MSKIAQNISQEEKKLVKKMIRRGYTIGQSNNYATCTASGWTYALLPFIEKYYEKEEDRVAACKRHLNTYVNVTHEVVTLPIGLMAAMERQNSQDPDNFDVASINSLKLSLMGPLCGVGDTLFLNIIPVIAAGITIPIAESGSILAPILYLAINAAIGIATRHYFGYLGYSIGTDFISNMYESGALKKFMKGCSIVGLIIVGSLVAQRVNFPLKLSIPFAEGTIEIQTFFDSIFKGIIPLSLTLGMFWLVRVKKMKPLVLMLVLFVFALACVLLGIC